MCIEKLLFTERIFRIKTNMFISIIRNFYCLMCMKVTNGVHKEHELDGKLNSYIYCNNCGFKKDEVIYYKI